MSQSSPRVRLVTSMGEIVIELNAEKAPISTENFLEYVNDGFYDGTIFHRVIENFMIQGGGMTPDMSQKKTRGQIKNEAANGLGNVRGSLAMARTNVVDSATCQFFINVVDNDFLNHRGTDPSMYGYAVFGMVVEGMEIVDAIRKVATGSSGMHGDVPKEAVIIESASVVD
ncbi:MAG: peptidyl-prolyl cis-trans isomerase A [Desulfuromonas sp.]|nr:MAG: peptidyl-prolyl cis-trans isomerase A [Desulfuromonas sp.]